MAFPFAGPGPLNGGAAAESCRLRSVDDLPACFRPVYQGAFRYFNPVQSETFNEMFHSDVNVVLSAPTGAGKTVVLELAILRLLARHIDADSDRFEHRPGMLKAVYLAPAKALVQEKVREWQERFSGTLGLTIKEVTGDTDQEDILSLDSTDIICTTPEKFDSMTRRHRDRGGMRFFNEIALVLIDEVHLLTEQRGASLEAGVVSRIKLVSRMPQLAGQPIASVRYVAVSATVPNICDLAGWLGVPAQGVKVFGEEMRPVPLHTSVRGYAKTSNDFLFDRRLTDNVYSVLSDNSRGKPALVFCPSRAGTVATAMHIAKEAARRGGGTRPSALLRDPAHHARLVQAASALKDVQLRECVQAGVGFHHAAMEPTERAALEAVFRAHDLLVLCTTSTLAVGVNLPAYLVVIKGTRRYAGAEATDPSGYQEYDRSTCLQMVGRAGRPQFDSEGCAVIMTDTQSVSRYNQLVKGAEAVESTLRDALPEFLNAEIALRTVGDVSAAVAWLRTTFLHVRARRDPGRYGVPAALRHDVTAMEGWMRDSLVVSTVRELAKHGLVRTDEDEFALEPLQPGIIMAEHYVRLPTMALVCGCSSGAAMPQLLWVLARCAELSGIKLRRTEKKALNAVNRSEGVRFHVMSTAKPDRIADRIATAADKIFVLLNHALADAPGGDKLEYSLRQDAEQAVTVGCRLAAAFFKYFSHTQRASEAFNALLLQKTLKQRLWSGSRLETRQLPGVGAVTAERLAAAGIHSLAQLKEVDARKLESLAQRPFPWGTEVHAALRRCLPPALTLECVAVGWAAGGRLDLQVSLTRCEQGSEEGGVAAGSSTAAPAPGGRGGGSSRNPAYLLVGTLHDNELLVCRSLCLATFSSPLGFTVRTRTVTGARNIPVQVVASVVHERLVGVDVAVKTVVPGNAVLNGSAGPQAKAVSITAATSEEQLPETPAEEEKAALPGKTPTSAPRQLPLQKATLKGKRKRAAAPAQPFPAPCAAASGENAAPCLASPGEGAAATPAGKAPAPAMSQAQQFMQRKVLQAKAAATDIPQDPRAKHPQQQPTCPSHAPAGAGRWTIFTAGADGAAGVAKPPAKQQRPALNAAWRSTTPLSQRSFAAQAEENQSQAAGKRVHAMPPSSLRALRPLQQGQGPPLRSMQAAKTAVSPPPFASFAFGAPRHSPPSDAIASDLQAGQPPATLTSAVAGNPPSPCLVMGAAPRVTHFIQPLPDLSPKAAAGGMHGIGAAAAAAAAASPGPARAKRPKTALASLAWLTTKYAPAATAKREGCTAPAAATGIEKAETDAAAAGHPPQAPLQDLSQALSFL